MYRNDYDGFEICNFVEFATVDALQRIPSSRTNWNLPSIWFRIDILFNANEFCMRHMCVYNRSDSSSQNRWNSYLFRLTWHHAHNICEPFFLPLLLLLPLFVVIDVVVEAFWEWTRTLPLLIYNFLWIWTLSRSFICSVLSKIRFSKSFQRVAHFFLYFA